MNKEKHLTFAKGIIILGGVICFILAFVNLPSEAISWGFLLILVFSTTVIPRMSLALPHARLAISFSDAFVFLAFLLYGGPAAILVAIFESIANCLYLRSSSYVFSRLMIPTNVSINAVSMGLTYLVWSSVTGVSFVAADTGSTQNLIVTLGSLALLHFLLSSLLLAVFYSLKDGLNLFPTWQNGFFSTSMTQIVGAGLAGVIYKLINYGDIITTTIAFLAIGIAYLSYRRSIDDVNAAINQAEEAEREKADTERNRRREAEKHASQLTISLKKEEQANEALRKSEQDLQHAALYDSLTDLPNRKHFGDMLRKLIDEYKNDPSVSFHVLFLDIRKFKNINDSLGHTLGDKVLMIAAKRFVRMVNSSDLVARIGGDEFAIILKNLSTSGKAQKVARRIFDSISQPFSLSSNRISISVNIGIAPCDTEYDTPEEILRDADIAMHYAREKNSGVAVFTKELRVRFLERVRFENDLRLAIDRNELSMNYQPLVSLQDGELMGVEALLRWHHSEFGLIPPNKFIPIAEESGLIIPITVWILQETTNQIARWQKISRAFKNLVVSVNISGKHLSNDDLRDDVENALAMSRISPKTLKLEITESAAMENAEHTINMLNKLKQIGVQLSIDDFGTGYSSLSYLHRLPFDTLKIDRSFVCNVGSGGENSEILQTIVSLAKSLKKKVIAEGIETEAQLSLLQNLGCDYGQGYLLARPQTKENMEKALYEGRNWLPAKITDHVEHRHVETEENLPVF